ncbi:MAG: 2-amino-4-hydroxy-6-hydroxymethyldihydropteridine diphosphokinase [Clostridia bacterium]|nr:2-amino-4-hydroxy-6-hydroxymethyldihydropteridine diphosphokinase [Clostridia bacterium]
MDYIFIEDLKVVACHGVKDFEKVNPQPFWFCAKLFLDMNSAAKNDDLTQTVNYSTVCKTLTAFCVNNCFDLIETLADKSARLLLNSFPLLCRVELTVKKPEAPVKLPFDCISVTVERGWHTAYLALGGNLGDKKTLIDFAVSKLNEDENSNVVTLSDYIETEPYGGVATEQFLNCALELRTMLSPYELLELTNAIEKEAGRERKEKWGNRTLDIDILLYDDLILNTKELTIPHPEMKKRKFVLEPLNQIAPHLVDPIEHKKFIDIFSGI